MKKYEKVALGLFKFLDKLTRRLHFASVWLDSKKVKTNLCPLLLNYYKRLSILSKLWSVFQRENNSDLLICRL